MDGLLIIDKPAGMTSHDVVSRVRRVLKTKSVGHTGTLDPFATGVLVLLIGKATRLARFVDKDVKQYEALVQFGSETDTGDNTGTGIAECGLPKQEISKRLRSVDWEGVLAKFRGRIMQTPPMYSAKKVEGKKLYELARKGVKVVREPVAVRVHNLELLEQDIRSPETALRIRVACSAGTYIRTLAEDIGREVGTGAHLLELRRTAAGRFDLNDAIALENLENHETPASVLRPITDIVDGLPAITLAPDRVDKTMNGLPTRVSLNGLPEGAFVQMLDGDKVLIAIGAYDEAEKTVKPKIVLG